MKEAEPSCISVCPDRLYEGYVFDLDGTIYLGDELLPGAKRLLEKLRELRKARLCDTHLRTTFDCLLARKFSAGQWLHRTACAAATKVSAAHRNDEERR